MSWKLIKTVTVAVLLLFVALDLGVPGVCKTDELPQNTAASSPVEHAPSGDDCFCCCIHILPEQFWASYVHLGWTAMAPAPNPSSPDRHQPPFQLPPRA